MHTPLESLLCERKQEVKWIAVAERKGRDAGEANSYSESDLKHRCVEPCGDLPQLMNLTARGEDAVRDGAME